MQKHSWLPLFLSLCATACAHQPSVNTPAMVTIPPPLIIERRVLIKPPASYAPDCAVGTEFDTALSTVGTLLTAWLVDQAALESCALKFKRLWDYVNQNAAVPVP